MGIVGCCNTMKFPRLLPLLLIFTLFRSFPCQEAEAEPKSEEDPEAEFVVNRTTCRCEILQTRIFAEINDKSGCADVAKAIYTALGVISVLALLLTIIVYSILPGMRNLHGRILMSCAFSTLLATLYLIIVYNYDSSCTIGCTVLGYFGLFSNLSMFSWMTIMCLNMVWTFKSMRAVDDIGSRFLIFSALGWGFPFLFSATTLIFQLTTHKESSFNPEIGIESCFVDDHIAYRQLIFFHLPIFILLLLNLAGFVYCIVHIWKNNAGNSRRGRTEEGKSSMVGRMRINKEARDQLVIYAKLFMIFGLPWLSESIQYFTQPYRGDGSHLHNGVKMINPVTCRNGFSETLFRIISCYNLLRGLFLFIMFVCKTTVIRKVKKTLGIETSSTTTPSKKDSTGASQFSSNDGHSMHTTADSMHTTVHSTPETGRRRAGTIQTR